MNDIVYIKDDFVTVRVENSKQKVVLARLSFRPWIRFKRKSLKNI